MLIKEQLDLIKQFTSSAPVDVFELAKRLGLNPIHEYMNDEISGLLRKSSDSYQIVVNANHSVNRNRFTVAHEIGHFIYHRHLLDGGVGDTRAYRSEGTSLPNSLIGISEEREANTVAANILMPRDLVTAKINEGIKSPKDLSRLFGVSEMAMKIRLGLA